MLPFFLTLYNGSQVSIVALRATCILTSHIKIVQIKGRLIVGILTFMSRINFMLNSVEHELSMKCFYRLYHILLLAIFVLDIHYKFTTYEKHHEKTPSSRFPTRSDTNRAVYPHKSIRGLQFRK